MDDLIADNVGVGNMNGGGSPFFKENGNYQASHAINMAFEKLLNLSTPSEPYEATTKEYVDNSITKGIEKETRHIIAATASYHGDLIKGDYQFTFGGSSVKSYKKHDYLNGFVVPHSGYIKRFVVKSTGFKLPSENIDSNALGKSMNICDDESDGRFITNPTIIPLFTLNVIKNNDGNEVIKLGVLNMQITTQCEKYNIAGDISKIRRIKPDIITELKRTKPTIIYSFTSFLPEGIEKYHLSPKDILNIRSEFSTEKLNNPYLIIENEPIPISFKEDGNISPSFQLSKFQFNYRIFYIPCYHLGRIRSIVK